MSPDPELLAAERAIDELRCGRPIAVAGSPGLSLYASVETINTIVAGQMRKTGRGAMLLVISEERARALGVAFEAGAGALALPLPDDATLPDMVVMATHEPHRVELHGAWADRLSPGDGVDRLVVRLLKAAWLLPAALRVNVPAAQMVDIQGLIGSRVLHAASTEGLTRLFDALDDSVVKISEARIPLADAADARFVCFRTSVAAREHLAIVIGTPDQAAGVPVRLHSACLTGDVFGSLRCDCGDQLRQSVAALQALGGGVLLYLAQEGRGIGLANKLRAYALQDGGRDTIDADLQLGFRPDERQYGIAAAMLQALGIHRVRLMTNNPQKIEALTSAGIAVIERLPLLASITPENQRYMDAKRQRAHHLLDPAGL